VILFVLATFREINYNIRDGVNRAKDKYLSVTYDSDVLLNEKNRSKAHSGAQDNYLSCLRAFKRVCVK